MFAAIQNAAQSFGVEVRPIIMRDVGEIERAIVSSARSGNGGLIVAPSGSTSVHRLLLIRLAARHKLPTVYPYRYIVADGGLMSYAPDPIDRRITSTASSRARSLPTFRSKHRPSSNS